MALVVAAGAIGAGVSALWYFFRSNPNSSSQIDNDLLIQELRNLVINRSEELHTALSKAFPASTEESRAFSAQFATILRSISKEVTFSEFKRCIASELAICDQPVLFFRANNFSSRLAMDILKQYSQIYVEQLSSPLQQHFATLKPGEGSQYELTSSKVESMELNGQTATEYLENAQQKFISLCDVLFESVCSTPVPIHIKFLLREINQSTASKWPGKSSNESKERTEEKDGEETSVPPLMETFDAIGGVLVLRLITPALAMSQKAPHDLQMTLVRACQVLQSVSNEVFSRRELDMLFINDWMKEKIPILKKWKRDVLDSAPTTLDESFALITQSNDTINAIDYKIISNGMEKTGLLPNQSDAKPSPPQPI